MAALCLAGLTACSSVEATSAEPTATSVKARRTEDVCADYRGVLAGSDESLEADLRDLAAEANADLGDKLTILANGVNGDLSDSEVRERYVDAMSSVGATCQV